MVWLDHWKLQKAKLIKHRSITSGICQDASSTSISISYASHIDMSESKSVVTRVGFWTQVVVFCLVQHGPLLGLVWRINLCYKFDYVGIDTWHKAVFGFDGCSFIWAIHHNQWRRYLWGKAISRVEHWVCWLVPKTTSNLASETRRLLPKGKEMSPNHPFSGDFFCQFQGG